MQTLMIGESNAGTRPCVPGELCDNARQVFTLGQCHALALAVHDLTGWELAACEFGGWFQPADIPGHVFVLTPEGEPLDAKGCGEDSDALNSCRYDDMRPVSRAFVESLAERGEYYEPTPHAHLWAPTVAAMGGWQ